MRIISAKFDNIDVLDIIKQNIEDICLDFGDDYNSKITVVVNPHGDRISLSMDFNSFVFNDNFGNDINDISERIKDYLSMENFNFDYLIKYKVHSKSIEFDDKLPIFYFGNKPPFDKIIPEAKKYTDRYEDDSYNPLWSDSYKALDISKLNLPLCEDEKLSLNTDGIKTLLSDMENCFTVKGDVTMRRSWNLEKKFKPLGIMVDYINITFNKK